MKLVTIVCFWIAFSLNSYSQNIPVGSTDSSRYYLRQLGIIRKKNADSLFKSEEFQTAMKLYRNSIKKSDNFSSFVLFIEEVSADFANFNNSIAASGFPAIKNSPVTRFGLGFSNKIKKTIIDFNFFAFSIPRHSKKGDEKINTTITNACILEIGYDFAKSSKINIYPYAGASLRLGFIDYTKPSSLNPSFTNISNLVQNSESASADYTKLGFQAGVGFDFVLKESDNALGTIVFIKAGISRILGKESYNVEGIKYIPGINYGKWSLAAGIKLFGRR